MSGASIPLTNAFAVVMAFFVIVGMIGNLASIFVIVMLKEYKKSVTHWYVLQLSVASFFFLLTIPFKIVERLRYSWPLSETWCKANQTIIYLGYNASIFFLMIMSIDRYIAVCRPMSLRLQQLRKRTNAIIITICLWAIAFLLCIPVMLYSFKVGTFPSCFCTYKFDEPEKSGSDYDYCNGVFPNQTEYYERCVEHFYKEVLESDEKHCLTSAPVRLFASEKNHGMMHVSHTLQVYGISTAYMIAKSYKAANYSTLTARVRVTSVSIYSGDWEDYYSFLEKMWASNYTETSTCSYYTNSKLWFGVLMFNFLLLFVIPALVMIACYGLIVLRLFQTRMTRTTSTSSSVSFTRSFNSGQGRVKKQKRKLSSSRSDKDRIRVTAMCATLVLSFFVLWLPFQTTQVGKWVGLNLSNSACVVFDIVGLMFAYMSAAVYPYLYAFLGTKFRKRFNTATNTFRMSFSKRKRSSASSASFIQLHRKNTSTNRTCVSKLNRTETNPRICAATVDTTDTLDKKTTHSQCENSSPE